MTRNIIYGIIGVVIIMIGFAIFMISYKEDNPYKKKIAEILMIAGLITFGTGFFL